MSQTENPNIQLRLSIPFSLPLRAITRKLEITVTLISSRWLRFSADFFFRFGGSGIINGNK